MVHINVSAGILQVVPLLSLGKDIFLNFLFYTGAQPINNFVIVSGEQQRDSAIHIHVSILSQGLPWWLSGKESTWIRKIPWSGNGNLLQYSCLGNPTDRGAWRPTVHGVAKESDITQSLNNNNILPQTRILSRLPHNTEQSSLCYTVGPCSLSNLNLAV